MIEAVLIMTVAWAVISTAAAMYQWERHWYWRVKSAKWRLIADLWRGLVTADEELRQREGRKSD